MKEKIKENRLLWVMCLVLAIGGPIYIVSQLSDRFMQASAAVGSPGSVVLNPEFINDQLVFNQMTITAEGIQNKIDTTGDGNVRNHALIEPVTMKFVPGQNSIFVVEKKGRVRHVTYDVAADGGYENFQILPNPIVDIRDITSFAVDRGLLGLAIDPDFENNGFIYLGYTYENDPSKPAFELDPSIINCDGFTEETAPDRCTQLAPKTARVSRFTVVNGTASRDSEKVLLGEIVGSPSQPSCSYFKNGVNVDCIFADSGSHAAPSLDFFLDGTLGVWTGDGAGFYQAELQAFRSMYLDNLSGKALRIDPETGKGLTDNPFYTGNVDDVQSKIWATGLRNPYGLQVVDTGNDAVGEPIGGMVGWNQVEAILRVPRGGFMGWPCFSFETTVTNYKFLCDEQNPQRPLDLAGNEMPTTPAALIYRHQPVFNYASAVAGGAFLESPIYGDNVGEYVFADYRIGQSFKGTFNNDYTTLSVPREDPGGDNAPLIPFAKGGLNAPVAFITAPNGIVYIVDIFSGRIDGFNFGSIVELTVQGDAPEKTIAEIDVNIAGSNSLSRVFDCDRSVVHTGEPTNCFWDFGDGNTDRVPKGESANNQYAAQGTYKVTLTIETLAGDILATTSENVTITDLDNVPKAEPFLVDATLPNINTAISQNFDVTVRVGNNGVNAPFYIELKAFDETSAEVGELRSQHFVSGIGNGAFTTHTFENLVFRDEGDYDFNVNYLYADSDGNILGESAADFVGQIKIFSRSGEPEPEDPTAPFGRSPENYKYCGPSNRTPGTWDDLRNYEQYDSAGILIEGGCVVPPQ